MTVEIVVERADWWIEELEPIWWIEDIDPEWWIEVDVL